MSELVRLRTSEQSKRLERSQPRVDLHVLTLTFTPDQSHPTRFAILFHFMLLIFVLTDANEATYSIEFGSNFSLR